MSEDGHPIGGSLSFAVGAPSDVVDVPTDGAEAGTDAPVLLGLVRGLGYVGLLVGAGAAAFAVLFLPRDGSADRSRARLRPVARVAAGVAALGWWLAVPLVALYQLGLPVSALMESSTWTSLALAEYGVPAAVVLGLLLVVGAFPTSVPGRVRGALVLAGCALAVTAPAFTGHTRAATPEALLLGVDVLHLAAGTLWLGGLVAIALVLGDLARSDAGAVVLGRFSAWAAGVLVVVLVVTGFLVDRSPEPDAAVGPATLTIAMTDEAGASMEGYEAPVLSLTSGEVELGAVQLSSLGPGLYAGEVVVPTGGEWEVQVSLRTTEFDNPVRTVTFQVP